MAEKLGRNCVYVGSFNPIHIGHVQGIDEILESFDYANIFVRYTEGMDLVDWETKSMWFENISRERDGRVRFFKEVHEEKEKNYDMELFYTFIRKTEDVVGESIDGFYFGEDYRKMIPMLEAQFPDKIFIIGNRPGFNSTAIRNDIEGHKDWLPPFVYESIKDKV